MNTIPFRTYRDDGTFVEPKIGDMIGRTFSKIAGKVGDEELTFYEGEEPAFRFFYEHDCCASCTIEEIIGDLGDLIGAPLTMAEEVSSEDHPEPQKECVDSYTWTFYKFATTKGYVTVRWLGESNGYYSESVTFENCEIARGER